MKKFSVGRWGQINLLGDKNPKPARTVRAIFIVMIAVVVIAVFAVAH